MKKFVTFSIMLIVTFTAIPNISTQSLTEFEVTSYNENEAVELFNSTINSVSSTYIADKGSSDKITSFDVSDNDMVVIGIEGSFIPLATLQPRDHILVFDSSKTLLYCIEYYYYDSGSIFVEWNGDNILVFDRSGSFIIELTIKGELVNVYDVDYTDGENNKIKNQISRKNQLTVNGITYKMERAKNFMYHEEYTSITATNSQGETTEFFNIGNYESESNFINKYLFQLFPFIVIGGLIIMTIIPTIIFRSVLKNKNSTKQNM